ncbi:MAG TPA: methyl-accepting chemotaxis protein [Noviherbaspirillum sp.]|uniref:methyl-accepting chemotaxis protein n=1 Tax=Noviherbaspirillum sp. TaxID=1926288 RepID=UPI002B4A031B|nr:methyl-accepting chemotaxis protein [Noviherbaspirillum sp.]HJV85205.1 methyl-accepting chemotaxis protein [Noviherbaspirillum sp.]
MKFWRTRIETRFMLAFAVILAFMAFTTALSVWRLYSVDRMAKVLVNEKLARSQLIASWQNAVALNATRATAIAKSDSLELGDYFQGKLTDGDKSIAELAASVRRSAAGSVEIKLLDRIGQAGDAYLKIRNDVFRLKSIGKTIEVEQLVSTKLDGALAAYEGALHALAEYQNAEANRIAHAANDIFTNSVVILIGAGGLALVLGACLAVFLSRSIVLPLRDAAAVATRVASGNLTSAIQVRGQDEISALMRALQQMNDNLAHMARDIRDGVSEIDGALADIARDNEDLARRTVAQAESVRVITGSMAAMTTTVKRNAEHTQEAHALAADAARVATEGGSVVAEVVRTMGSINASSRQIAEIIGVIDGIAFQTNILALNAAVEAVRAGEHGRGFAVVANEVRNLSRRSATAAQEIRSLITNSVNEIANGSDMVNRAGATMQQVVASINEVTGIVAHIKTASDCQTADLLNIGQSIHQIDRTTQQNSELVQDAVRAIDDLTAQSMRVSASVSRFRIDARKMPAAPVPLSIVAPSELVAMNDKPTPRRLIA